MVVADHPAVIDGYEILEPLGQGGMGWVYRARRQGLVVALKVLRPAVGSTLHDRLRFQREFALAGRLNHPGLVKVYEQGNFQGQPYFTMELVDGLTLREYFNARRGQSDWMATVQGVFNRLLEAIQYIHRHGVLHRDLKPENILVEDSGQPRLLDFGLARPRDLKSGAVTEPGTLVGTVHYMAPEQIRGGELDFRADLYALGVLLYETLTGRLPFDHPDLMALVCAILHEEPPPPGVGDALDRLVLKLLAREPADRYQSAGELLHAWAAVGGASPERQPESPELNLLTPRFVGREAELAALTEFPSGLVLVEGASGVGKSRFLEEAAACLRQPTRPVLASQAGETPYSLWLPFLRRTALPSRLEPFRPMLAAVLPELGSTNQSADDPVLRFRLFEGMRQLLSTQAGARGLVLILEDLHRADPASVEFLGYLLGHEVGGLLLIASLQGEPPPGLRGAKRVFLEPLNPEQTAVLARSMLGYAGLADDTVQALHQETEGNPLFLVELLRTFVSEGRLRLTPTGWSLESGSLRPGSLSVTVRQALQRRLEALEPQDLEIARQAAVLGMSFEFDSLQQAALLPAEQLLECLERLTRGRILAENLEYRFCNRPLWEIFSEKAPAELHRRAALALSGRAEPARLAHHHRMAGQGRLAAEQLVRAAEAAIAVFAYRDALELLQLCSELPEPDQVLSSAELEERRAEALEGSGRPAQARQSFERLVEGAPNRKTRLRLMRKLGTCCQRMGELTLASRVLSQALAVAGWPLPSRSWTGFLLGLARDPLCPDEVARILEHLTRVLFYLRSPGWKKDTLAIGVLQRKLLHRPGSRADSHQASLTTAYILNLTLPRATLPHSRRLLLRSVSLYREEPHSLQKAAYFRETAFLLFHFGDARDGLRLSLEGLELSTRLGDVHGLAPVHSIVYMHYRFFGDLRNAREHSLRAQAAARETGNPIDLALSTINLGTILALQRRFAELDELLAENAERTSGFPFAEASTMFTRALQALFQGRSEQALELAQECYRYCSRHEIPVWKREARVLEVRALVELSSRNPALRGQAGRLLARARWELAGLVPGLEAVLRRTQGDLLFQAGEREKARRDYLEALDLLVGLGHTYEQGNTHMTLSSFYEGDQPERSRRHRELAHECWARCDVLF
ncbi:hypothetical protein DYH09_18410 [bacterium CPR1]|nr:hypothetical protein [bacterium CPR1]